jgi:hypothetical protein
VRFALAATNATSVHFHGSSQFDYRICGRIIPFAMPYENDRPVFICRDMRVSLEQRWDRLKRYR